MNGIDEWSTAQERVIRLMSGLTVEQAERTVPACPGWTVRQLFSHMVGLGADVADGDEPDDHNEEWTVRQVRQRADHDVATLIAEWRAVADPLRSWMAANGDRPLGDVIIHEQDLRGAVGVSGGQDSAGVAAIRDRFAGRVGAAIADLPPLALAGDRWRWGPEDAAVVVAAPDFELARAVVSRRSAAQLRAWTRRGDITPYLGGFALLGDLPGHDLHE